MQVLISDGYPMTFNLPDEVRRDAVRGHFVNLGRLWGAADAIAFHPRSHSCQVIHCMNKIPLMSRTPWVVTFESGLPRTHNRSKALGNLLRERILSPKCLGIIAMSQWASDVFQLENRDWEKLPQAMNKLSLIYPTVQPQRSHPKQLKKDETLEIAFIGNQFALKGGIVALRLARKASDLGLKIKIHIVSGMKYARGGFLDHPDPERYADDLKYLDHPNIRFYGSLPNKDVQQILEHCHLLFLGSLHDTFGFSVLEGFSWGLPALTTDICALPEMVTTGENGYFLHLPKNERNCWTGADAANSNDYWSVLNGTYESLTNQALESITSLLDDPRSYERLSLGSIQTVINKFHPDDAARAIGKIYQKVESGRSSDQVKAWDKVA